MTVVKSLREGDSVDERKILDGVSSNNDPDENQLGWHLNGADFMHVYIELEGGASAAGITPWYWSSIAGQWFEGDALSFTAADRMALVEVRGEEKVFFRVDSVTGGEVSVWGGYSYEGRVP